MYSTPQVDRQHTNSYTQTRLIMTQRLVKLNNEAHEDLVG